MLRSLKIICLFLVFFTENILAASNPRVAVASNMSHAMTDIASSFQQESGIRAELTFGSSGNVARQIILGAPFSMFLSADAKYIDLLTENGLKPLADIEYARGRIVLFIPKGSPLSDSTDLQSAITKLGQGKFNRLVIANPGHAPYGVAAMQAIRNVGLQRIDKQRLLLAENAAQATQIALSGNVDAGIIPASFTHLTELQDRGIFFIIPESLHQPLQQRLVLFEGATNMEKQFFKFMQNQKSLLIIKKYGYSITLPAN